MYTLPLQCIRILHSACDITNNTSITLFKEHIDSFVLSYQRKTYFIFLIIIFTVVVRGKLASVFFIFLIRIYFCRILSILREMKEKIESNFTFAHLINLRRCEGKGRIWI